MSSGQHTWVRQLALSFILVPVLGLGWAKGAAATELRVGQPAPALKVPTLAGAEFDLAAKRSKVVVVNFWATWCQPCQRELPLLNKVYQRYRGRDLQMLGVSVDRARDRDAVAKFSAKTEVPLAMQSDATVNDFAAPSALPVTVVIDQQGRVQQVFTNEASELSEQALVSVLDRLYGGVTGGR